MTLCEAVTRPIKQDGAGPKGHEAIDALLPLGGSNERDIPDGDVVGAGRVVPIE